METMLHGSQFYMLFKEAFHIYVHFFETNKDEEASRDILLHPETGLNVMIVMHPVTLKWFVVLNNPSCDVSLYTRIFTRGWVKLLLNIRLHVKGLEPLNNATPRHVFLAFQTIKTRRFVLK